MHRIPDNVKPLAVENYESLIGAAEAAENKNARLLATKSRDGTRTLYMTAKPITIRARLNGTYADRKKYGRREVHTTVTERVKEYVESLCGVDDKERKAIQLFLMQSIFAGRPEFDRIGHAYRATDVIAFDARFKKGVRVAETAIAERPENDIKTAVLPRAGALLELSLKLDKFATPVARRLKSLVDSNQRAAQSLLRRATEGATCGDKFEDIDVAAALAEFDDVLVRVNGFIAAPNMADAQPYLFEKAVRNLGLSLSTIRLNKDAVRNAPASPRRGAASPGNAVAAKMKSPEVQRALADVEESFGRLKAMNDLVVEKVDDAIDGRTALSEDDLRAIVERLVQVVDKSGLPRSQRSELRENLFYLEHEIDEAKGDKDELRRLAAAAKEYTGILGGLPAQAGARRESGVQFAKRQGVTKIPGKAGRAGRLSVVDPEKTSRLVEKLLLLLEDAGLTTEEQAKARATLVSLRVAIDSAGGDNKKLKHLARCASEYEIALARRKAEASADTASLAGSKAVVDRVKLSNLVKRLLLSLEDTDLTKEEQAQYPSTLAKLRDRIEAAKSDDELKKLAEIATKIEISIERRKV